MRKINFTHPEELYTALGKKGSVSFNVIGLPSENLIGILTNIQFNTHDGSLRVIFKIEDASLAIPLKDITSFELED